MPIMPRALFDLFNSTTFIFALMLLCYHSNARYFRMLSITVLLSFIINVYLKQMWQIPLDTALNKRWWGFPSGHMQILAVAYLGVFLHYKRKWMIPTLLILLYGIAESMIRYKYHDIPEMVAALAVAVMLLLVMHCIYDVLGTKKHCDTAYAFLAALFLLSSLSHLLAKQETLAHYQWTLSGLAIACAITIGSLLDQKTRPQQHSRTRLYQISEITAIAPFLLLETALYIMIRNYLHLYEARALTSGSAASIGIDINTVFTVMLFCTFFYVDYVTPIIARFLHRNWVESDCKKTIGQ